jgi:hypothetical protein
MDRWGLLFVAGTLFTTILLQRIRSYDGTIESIHVPPCCLSRCQ